MSPAMRSNLASACAAVAVCCLGVLAMWSQRALDVTEHTNDLVAQLCAKGADRALCAEAGVFKPGIRYVMTGRPGVTRWPQFAEPVR